VPKISIVVTTYNRKELLRETIQSILNQTFNNFELIVIDNFSNYNFLEFIKEFDDPRISAFQNKNEGIIAVNRNFGMRLAKGEFIALCDDDDLWEVEKLSNQIKILEKKQNYAMVCTASSFIGIAEKKNFRKLISNLIFKMIAFNWVHSKYLLLGITYITNSSVLFRSRILSDIGYISEEPSLVSVEDYDFWIQIGCFSNIYFLNKKLVKYRFHTSQVSTHNLKESLLKTEKVIYKNWGKLNRLQKIICKTKSFLNNMKPKLKLSTI
jgi:glycosyltransferase involved in cell wall biosynthesis